MEISVLRQVLVAAAAGAVLSACGPGEPPDPAEGLQSAVAAQAGHEDFGDYEIHYRALITADLLPEVALEYDIPRAENRAMLTVTVLGTETAGDAPGRPVQAEVQASLRNIMGQVRELDMRELQVDDAVYYVADFAVRDEQTLTFEIEAVPAGTSESLGVRFEQQFFVD